MPIIYPVIASVPGHARALNRKDRNCYTRLITRKSAIISSERSGLLLKRMYKDKFGVPLKYSGVYWSITHKPKYVGGVTSTTPVGIDVEEILSRYIGHLCNKVADSYEWNLDNGEKKTLFFRYWSAKEAVLKAERRAGLVGLSRCFIKQIIDGTSMILSNGLNKWYVEHFYFSNHIAAIATKIDTNIEVRWLLLNK